MKFVIIALALSCYHLAEGANWALLVAGSNGYNNYRHQSDVCHSYQLLRQHGIPASNIIVMMYDDIAYNSRNPVQGNIINQPNGPNVYKGVTIDYRTGDVTPENFLNVLQGKTSLMKGIGSGRVIESGPNDNVFVYYADHGNKHIIAFPDGDVLASWDLNQAILYMFKNNKYSKLVLYIEACFSGSMFFGQLPEDKNVYAITAANRKESSYACYYDKLRRTFLGDEFSVRWMQDSESHDFSTHSLWNQYLNIKNQVQHSHIMAYGDLEGLGKLPIGQFQSGNGKLYQGPRSTGGNLPPITDAIPTWDVPYMSLMYQLQDAKPTEERTKILYEMQQEQAAQLSIKETMEKIVRAHSSNPALMMQVQETINSPQQQRCYEQCLQKYLKTCSQFKGMDYAMKDLHVFANICNRGTPFESIGRTIEEICAL